jgi:hypothetical protein
LQIRCLPPHIDFANPSPNSIAYFSETHAFVLARTAWYTGMAKKKESEFDKLARLIKEEGDDIRSEARLQIGGLRSDVHDQIGGLRNDMHEGFAALNRRLDQIIQMQLDEHAGQIKKLETAVFPK